MSSLTCKCGSVNFYRVTPASGSWHETLEVIDGKCIVSESSTDGLQNGITPKTIRCSGCNKRYPNPDYIL